MLASVGVATNMLFGFEARVMLSVWAGAAATVPLARTMVMVTV